MKKKNIIIFVLAFCSVHVFCQTWKWARCGGGNTNGEGYSVCLDASNNAIITGFYYSSNTVFGTHTLTPFGGAYLVKYDQNGNVIWARNPIGPGTHQGFSVCSDASSNIFLAGSSTGSPVFGSYTLTNSGIPMAYLVKHDPSGNPMWARKAIGKSEAWSTASDASGNILVAGRFFGPTVVLGTYTLTNSGAESSFLAKYDNNGNVLWAKGTVGTNTDVINSVVTDVSGNVFITGSFRSPTLAIGATTLTRTGKQSLFLAKYDTNGNVLWARSAGADSVEAMSVSVDPVGNPYITGVFYTNANTSIIFGTYTLTGHGGSNASNSFLVKYDASGNIVWAKAPSATGPGSTFVKGYFVNAVSGDIHFGGFIGVNPMTLGSYTLNIPYPSSEPLYVAKADQAGNITSAFTITGGGDDWSTVAVDNNCNLYLSGDFLDTALILGADTLKKIYTSTENIFIAKLSYPCSTNINGVFKEDPQVSVFPNPASGELEIISENAIREYEVIITNSLGQKVLSINLKGRQNSLDIRSLSRGFYNYIIQQDNIRIGRGKLIIE